MQDLWPSFSSVFQQWDGGMAPSSLIHGLLGVWDEIRKAKHLSKVKDALKDRCDYPLQIPTPLLINHVHLSEFPPLWVSAFTFLLLFLNLIGFGVFFSAFSFNTGENQIWWSLRSDILESAFAVPTLSLLYLTVSLNKWAGILPGRCHFRMNALQTSVWNIIARNVYVSTWSW